MQPHELPEPEFYDMTDSHADLQDRREIDRELSQTPYWQQFKTRYNLKAKKGYMDETPQQEHEREEFKIFIGIRV